MEPPKDRSALRFVAVIMCNAVLFVFGARCLFDRSELLYWRIFSFVICALLLVGTILEIQNRKAAKTVNIGVPLAVGVVFVISAFIWVEPEGGGFMLIFSLAPFFLAAVVAVGYTLDRMYLGDTKS